MAKDKLIDGGGWESEEAAERALRVDARRLLGLLLLGAGLAGGGCLLIMQAVWWAAVVGSSSFGLGIALSWRTHAQALRRRREPGQILY